MRIPLALHTLWCQCLALMPKNKPNPRGPVHNWKELYRKVEQLRRKDRLSLEAACVEVGIAYSTYHDWKRRLAKEAE
jgi:hypothetical protein